MSKADVSPRYLSLFFFNYPAPTEISPLSLHDALPISPAAFVISASTAFSRSSNSPRYLAPASRSEEHTSELQSHVNLVCRLLLEKKKKGARTNPRSTSRPHVCAPLQHRAWSVMRSGRL